MIRLVQMNWLSRPAMAGGVLLGLFKVFSGAALCLGAPGVFAQFDQSWDLEKTFFVGAYYDTRANKNSHLIKYLVAPNLKTQARLKNLRGNELTPLVRDALKKVPGFLAAANLSLDTSNSQGNPVAFFISRAEHQVHFYKDGNLKAYFTTYSVTAHLDIFTDQSVMENARRFQTLYSNIQLVVTPVNYGKPPSSEEFEARYKQLLEEAVIGLAERATNDLQWERKRSEAVFQVARFILPKKLSPTLEGILTGSIESAGDVMEAKSRRRELRKLELELGSTINFFVQMRLREKGVSHITLLPPNSPWSDGKVLRLLKNRPGMEWLGDSPILAKIDVNAMNGFVIWGLWAGEKRKLYEKTQAGGRAAHYIPLIAAAIYRPDEKGKPVGGSLPKCLANKKDRKPIGKGLQPYTVGKGQDSVIRREVTMDGVQLSAQQVAERLVEMMLLVSKESAGAQTGECQLPKRPRAKAGEVREIEGFNDVGDSIGR